MLYEPLDKYFILITWRTNTMQQADRIFIFENVQQLLNVDKSNLHGLIIEFSASSQLLCSNSLLGKVGNYVILTYLTW
jgi:hypothetical protein